MQNSIMWRPIRTITFILIGFSALVVGLITFGVLPDPSDFFRKQSTLLFLKNHSEYDALLHRWATTYDVDCTLAKAVIYQEDPAWNPREVSPKGAVGLMQVMPGTAGKTEGELFDPDTNIKAGVTYLSKLLQGGACPNKTVSQCQDRMLGANDCVVSRDRVQVTTVNKKINDETRFALAAYNGGPCGANSASVGCPGKARWECAGELPETENYVPRVYWYYTILKKNKWGC